MQEMRRASPTIGKEYAVVETGEESTIEDCGGIVDIGITT
jgi:hypothetical protein